MNEHYAAVLADLRRRRAKLEGEMRDVDAAISGLQRLFGESPTLSPEHVGVSPESSPQPASKPEISLPAHSRFANISVRWGVLWYLAEDAHGFVKTSEVAGALLAGGYKSEALRFPNLVSAVLSTMKAKGEVEPNDDGGYRLTEQGRLTWAHIRQGAKFRFATSPNEQTLLSVQ